jgi:hypothetical protein
MSKTERSAVHLARTRPCPSSSSSSLHRYPVLYAAPDLYKSVCVAWIDGIEIDRLHLLTTIYPISTQPQSQHALLHLSTLADRIDLLLVYLAPPTNVTSRCPVDGI